MTKHEAGLPCLLTFDSSLVIRHSFVLGYFVLRHSFVLGYFVLRHFPQGYFVLRHFFCAPC